MLLFIAEYDLNSFISRYDVDDIDYTEEDGKPSQEYVNFKFS